MKPKETQVLGLLITLLISLIVFDLYTIYCISSYLKLTSLDVVTSFAVVDALFFQSIKLIILSYGIFALSVEIRGIYITRERRNNKLRVKFKASVDKEKEENKESFTLQDVLDEAKVQEEASNLIFESNLPELKSTDEVIQRYGFNGYMSLSIKGKMYLSSTILRDKFNALREVNQYYHSRANDETDIRCWENVQHDLEIIDITLNTK